MRVLLSAYACEPGKGSEPGVGWHWCMELAKLGHEVWVLTRANNRSNIEHALAMLPPVPNLYFVYYDLPKWAGWWKQGPRIGFVNLYYGLWQWGAYCTARKLCKQHAFDAVHHLTFGVFRQPSFMGLLGIPFIVGPLGGGERAPFRLRKNYILRGHLVDFFRDILNFISGFDPLLIQMFKKASLIYVKTPETGRMIPPKYRHKVRVLVEIGIEIPDRQADMRTDAGFSVERPPRILFVGSFFCLKGLQLGIPAFAMLAREIPGAQLTLVGKGPKEASLKAQALDLGISEKITWAGWLPFNQLPHVYQEHDLLLFPSLHDSSGNVLLEALSYGLPVVCLNLGGPSVIIDDTCGVVVPVDGSADDVTQGLYHGLKKLLVLPVDAFSQYRRAARQRAAFFSWEKPVRVVYEQDLPALFSSSSSQIGDFRS